MHEAYWCKYLQEGLQAADLDTVWKQFLCDCWKIDPMWYLMELDLLLWSLADFCYFHASKSILEFHSNIPNFSKEDKMTKCKDLLYF